MILSISKCVFFERNLIISPPTPLTFLLGAVLLANIMAENSQQALVYRAWQQLTRPLQVAEVQQFHAQQKFLLLAYDQPTYRKLGRELANQTQLTDDFTQWYIDTLMAGLAKPASLKNNTNVLQHIQGFFKQQLDSKERQALAALILDYHRGDVALIAPLSLIKTYLSKYPNAYLSQQNYLYQSDLADGEELR